MRFSALSIFAAVSSLGYINAFSPSSQLGNRVAFTSTSPSRGKLTQVAAEGAPGPSQLGPSETTGIKALAALGAAGACLGLVILAPFATVKLPELPSKPAVEKKVEKPAPKPKPKAVVGAPKEKADVVAPAAPKVTFAQKRQLEALKEKNRRG